MSVSPRGNRTFSGGKTAITMLLWALAKLSFAQPAPVQFVEAPVAGTGLRWSHDNAKSAERHLPETVGSGAAIFDYNGDGWMDLYFVNSGPSDFFTPQIPLKNALYRNNRDGTFTDVTLQAGVSGGSFGMGAAAADYDNDGFVDLLVTNYGQDILYRNNGDGTFRDATAQAGISGRGWHTSAVWFDYDRDGKLDLFIASYVEYRRELVKFCRDSILQTSAYCVPKLFPPSRSRLYRNRGDGTFTDVSVETGIGAYAGKALGAVATDIDNDGWPDLFVASDMAPNALFLNRKGARFDEIGLDAGVAYSESGDPRSGMGADAADTDGDGWQDLLVANIDQQYFAHYRNLHDLSFREEHGELRRDTRLLSGWGLKFFDFDNDGDPDLLLANGHPDDMIDKRMPGVTYAEPLLLFENREGEFRNISPRSGAVFSRRFNARGLAIGDLDNDGDLDVIVCINGGRPVLLRNAGGTGSASVCDPARAIRLRRAPSCGGRQPEKLISGCAQPVAAIFLRTIPGKCWGSAGQRLSTASKLTGLPVRSPVLKGSQRTTTSTSPNLPRGQNSDSFARVL